MQPAIITKESFVEVEDSYRIWTKSFGGGATNERPPLLVLHGGPGMAHDYLENLAALASDTQKVIFYDQLGCGRSDAPNDPERWKIPRFVTEIDTVRQACSLDEVVILGQSWGGMLALEYFLTNPAGVKGGILSNSLSSAPLMTAEIQRLVSELPQTSAAKSHGQSDRDATGESPPDQKTLAAFYGRHILRLHPFPKKILEKMESTNQVYEVMWGKNEFSVTGNLRDWDRTNDLGTIKLPIQIISGEFDEATPKVNQVLHEGLTNSEWTLMPGCSHLPNFENPSAYQSIIQGFLDRINL